MRVLAIVVGVLLLAIQYPLWFGKGGWLRVRDLERQLVSQRATNDGLAARNAEVAAEVASLREGNEAVAERARAQLNMVRDGWAAIELRQPPASTEAITAAVG